MTSNKTIRRGFTLVELLVVVGMISVLLGAMTVSVSAANAGLGKSDATTTPTPAQALALSVLATFLSIITTDSFLDKNRHLSTVSGCEPVFLTVAVP